MTSPASNQGKTWFVRGVTHALRRTSVRVAALKPIETGCDPDPVDAHALAEASRMTFVEERDFHRVEPNVSPYAATLAGAPPFADPARVAARVREVASGYPVALVEGVGSLMMPLDRERTVADLAAKIGFPLLIVARDHQDCVAQVLSTYEVCRARGLRVHSIILSRHESIGDQSRATNHRILKQRLEVSVKIFPSCPNNNDALADAAEATGLVAELT